MKRFTISGFATFLQVIAVILLFSYAGHSPNNGSKEISPAKTSGVSDTIIELKSNMGTFSKGHVTEILLKKKAAE